MNLIFGFCVGMVLFVIVIATMFNQPKYVFEENRDMYILRGFYEKCKKENGKFLHVAETKQVVCHPK